MNDFSMQVSAEVAKGVGEAARELILSFFGPATRELGLWGGDLVAEWRTRNILSVYSKFKAKYGHKPFPEGALSRLPFGFRALFLEEASKEEDDSIQEMWASLLAAAVSDQLTGSYKYYVEAIKQFDPVMALCLKVISVQKAKKSLTTFFVSVDDQGQALAVALAKHSDAQILVSLERLLHLGVVSKVQRRLNVSVWGARSGGSGSVAGLADLVDAMKDIVGKPEISLNESIKRTDAKIGSHVLLTIELTVFGKRLLSLLEENRRYE